MECYRPAKAAWLQLLVSLWLIPEKQNNFSIKKYLHPRNAVRLSVVGSSRRKQTKSIRIMKTKTLPAGTIVHINGLPVELTQDTQAQTAEGNWEMIDNPPPSVPTPPSVPQ